MANILLTSFCQKLKREAFKEKIIGNHCILPTCRWIDSIKNSVKSNTTTITSDGSDSLRTQFQIMWFKIMNQIVDIMVKEQNRIYPGIAMIGIEELCRIFMQYEFNLEDGWAEKHTCDRAIDNLVQTFKNTLIRESSIPSLIDQLRKSAYDRNLFDESIVIDFKSGKSKY